MIDSILSFFTNVYNALTDFLKSLVLTIFDMLKDFLFFIIETVINIAKPLLAGVIGAPQFSLANYFTSLPEQTINVIALTGLPECVLLIISAIVIRLILQLIPFTRLGS